MDEETKDVAADTNAEEKEGADTNDNGQEDSVALQEKLEAAEKAKSQLTARAKKAEEELKALKAKPQENINNDPQLSDELKLIARGLSDEAIEQAKVIAKGKGISLPDATKDPLFEIYQKNEADKIKRENAKLGASKGSGESETQVTGTESGSTREEHIKAFKELTGK